MCRFAWPRLIASSLACSQRGIWKNSWRWTHACQRLVVISLVEKSETHIIIILREIESSVVGGAVCGQRCAEPGQRICSPGCANRPHHFGISLRRTAHVGLCGSDSMDARAGWISFSLLLLSCVLCAKLELTSPPRLRRSTGRTLSGLRVRFTSSGSSLPVAESGAFLRKMLFVLLLYKVELTFFLIRVCRGTRQEERRAELESRVERGSFESHHSMVFLTLILSRCGRRWGV